MKKSMISIVAALLAMSCSTMAIRGEGDVITKSSNVSASASEISISSAIKLTLSDKMQPGEISITTHENIHKYIEISNSADELDIELKDGNYKNLHIEIIASSAQYSDVEASGACDIAIDGAAAQFDSYSIDLSGASRFKGALQIANSLEVDLAGASKVDISGSAAVCMADLSGASKLYNTTFSCGVLEAELAGASKIKMSVSDSITGELSGASSINYVGSPKVSVETNGASVVTPVK